MATWFEYPDLPIRITAQGAWLHGDTPLHPRVAQLFAKHIVACGTWGPYIIRIGHEQQPLHVDDTAFFVQQIDIRHALQHSILHLSDGVSELLDTNTLMQSHEHILYAVIIRNGMHVPCRFMTNTYYEIADYLVSIPINLYPPFDLSSYSTKIG